MMSAVGGTKRIEARFAELRSKGLTGLITFITAGDPDPETSLEICKALVKSGADVIELGMPFTDPMADGPAIQKGNLRALKSKTTVSRTLEIIRSFRELDINTPIILMGYYNPIYSYGVEKFLSDALDSGCDGLIVVDIPPEEDEELCVPTHTAGMSFIRLATPTTDELRLPAVLKNTSGFLYYVSMAGITGVGSPDPKEVKKSVNRIRRATDLPIAVGFGIRTSEQAQTIAEFADAAVVGSAFVECIGNSIETGVDILDSISKLAGELSSGINSAQKKKQGA